jgi:hypothetical protein
MGREVALKRHARFFLKGLTLEMALAFDDMYGQF